MLWLRRLPHIYIYYYRLFLFPPYFIYFLASYRLLPDFSSLFVASGKAPFCQGQSSALHGWAYLPHREDTTTSMVQGDSVVSLLKSACLLQYASIVQLSLDKFGSLLRVAG